jgi:outer membrane receptor for ferrienterochelin and colicin
MPALALAAGKIRGKVIDKESKEALVGANVSIDGTTYGAATNVDGEYLILNVPAGTYTLKATFVGYATVTISNVRVNNDLATTTDFDLSSEAVALQGVEIVAERPLVNRNATNAVRITTSEDIANLPVRGINNVLALSPGVVLQDNVVFVRGGRQDEVGFYLEGVSITNPMVGGRAVTLVQDAVEEIQVQAGGYNAEFGGANSGIIQQQLRTGTSAWRFSLNYTTDNLSFKSRDDVFDGDKTLGAYQFGYNEATGTLSGPLFEERFKFFGLVNYLFNRDANPQPYPGINLGVITDPATGDQVDLTYPAGPVRKNSLEQITGTGTLTMDFKPLTVRLAGTYTNQTSYLAFNTARVPGNIANLLNTGRIEEVENGNGSISAKLTYLLTPTSFVEVTGGYFQQGQVNADPIMGDNYFGYGDSVENAQAGVTWLRRENDPNVGRYIRPSRLTLYNFAFNTPGEPVAGYAKFKRENFSFSGAYVAVFGEHSLKVGGEYQTYTMRNYSVANEGLFALPGLFAQNAGLAADNPQRLTTEQILKRRGVNNFGYDVYGNEIDSDDPIEGAKHPVFGAAYVQDKIEYRDLVLNLGLRFDYIDTDALAFRNPLYPDSTINKATNEIDPAGLVEVPEFTAVSPRIGLSFPVTDQTVFHTQFGKFVQQSRLRDIYQGLYLTGSNISGGFFIGAPVGFDVRPTRTTQYEIGFTQQIADFASFDVTGYYKDIKDQIVYDIVYSGTGSQFGSYAVLQNGDFATTKGIELTFNMRRQKRLQINASLSFNDARGTGSFPNSNRGIVGAPLDGVTIFTPQYVTPLEFNNTVRGNFNFDYRFGKGDGGPILSQLGASLLFTFNSGHPFTRGEGGADLEGDARDRRPVESLNSSTTPWVFQMDLKIDKTFSLFEALNATISLTVINLLDATNVENVFLRTGSTDDDGYLSDPALGGQLVNTYGPQYEAIYKAINIDYYELYQSAPFLGTVPFFYGPPRQVRLGLRLEY